MENYVETPEEIERTEKVSRLEASRMAWRLLALCFVGVWLFSKSQPHVSYIFHVYEDQIDITKSQWFHKDKTVSVSWRRDSDGQPGWCVTNKYGEWYKFIDPPYDEGNAP